MAIDFMSLANHLAPLAAALITAVRVESTTFTRIREARSEAAMMPKMESGKNRAVIVQKADGSLVTFLKQVHRAGR